MAFTLPGPGAARLEIVDVAGRRVASREVGDLGAGAHAGSFDARAMASGVYLVRLARADQHVTKKTVVVR